MPLAPLTPFLPARINTGHWVAGYSLDVLKQRVTTDRVVLPICSLGTTPDELAALAPLVLPPLYHEAFAGDPALKTALVAQIQRCFPYFEGTQARRSFRGLLEVVELPAHPGPAPKSRPKVLAFSVDTAVEQHGPHLPLGTDTIQSYAVLRQLESEIDGFVAGPPFDYGQLTWGLPFGMSIDLTAPLVTRYMTGFVNACVAWLSPECVYVADVHGSVTHRAAIQEGLRASRCGRGRFRWLHDPLVEFAGARGDPHAGGVETALVHSINPELVDSQWWPGRVDELEAGQMTMADAVELSSDLRKFIHRVENGSFNGIIGRIRNAFELDARELMARMVAVARADVHELMQ